MLTLTQNTEIEMPTLVHYQATFTDTAGNVRPGLSIEIRNEATGAIAAIYSDKDGNTAKNNPITTDDFGYGDFYVSQGQYRIQADGLDWRHVPITSPEAVEAAVTEAETARDAAQLNAGIYDDTTAGLAGTSDGDYFSTPSADSNEYLILYRNDAGSATEIETYPSVAGIQATDISGNPVTTSTGEQTLAGALDQRVIYVDTIADLQALDTSGLVDGQQVQVKEYHAGTGIGGGGFYWDATRDKSEHTGGSVIDPGRPYPSDFDDEAQVASWLNAAGTGGGVWVRPDVGEWDASQFGAVLDGTGDQWRLMQAWLNASAGRSAIWTGVMRYSSRVDVNGADTTLRGIGRGSALKPIWQGVDGFMDIVRVTGDGCALRDFHVDGSEWLDAVPFESREGTQWCRLNPRDVTDFKASGLSGYAVGNFLQLNNVRGFSISDIDVDDATLIVHMLGTSADGVISDLRGTRLVEAPVDWGACSGENFVVDNVNASAEGGWRETTGEGLDMGGTKSASVSNSVFDYFRQGVTLKGEGGEKWRDIDITDCQFLRCRSRGLSATPGSESAGGFGALRVRGCRFTSAPVMLDTSDITQESEKGFIRIVSGDEIDFSGNTVENGEPLFEAILYQQNLPSVRVSGNKIRSEGGGVEGFVSGGLALGGKHIITGNEVACESAPALAGGNCNLLVVKDNTVDTNPTIVSAHALDFLAAKEMDVSDNTINGTHGNAMRSELVTTKTLANVEETFITSPGIAKLRIAGNTIRNWGQGNDFRAAITLDVSNAAGTLLAGKVIDNVMTVDAEYTNSQSPIVISGAEDEKLDYWWFVGNITTQSLSGGGFSNKFGANTKQDNLFSVS